MRLFPIVLHLASKASNTFHRVLLMLSVCMSTITFTNSSCQVFLPRPRQVIPSHRDEALMRTPP